MRIPLLVVACLVAAILLLGGGFLLGHNASVRSTLDSILPGSLTGADKSTEDYELQQEVIDKLKSTYYKSVDEAELMGDAIDGMVAGLDDPYTVYLDPEEYADLQEVTKGSYSGVGMTVELKDRLVTIVSTFKGSPAQLAGIRPGDIILAVDGVSSQDKSLDEVVGMIKGTEGTTVVLEVYRPPYSTTTTVADEASKDSSANSTASTTADVSELPPGGETTDYTLIRRTIEVPTTDSKILETRGKKVALIGFYTFSEGSAAQLRSEVEKAVETDKVAAIILDLRSNGGGLLNEAVDVASIFISGGVVVTTEGLHSPEQEFSASGDAYTQIPLYVLTDPYTASASEIVSGALQDYSRATLVGETTFGKGLVQSIEPLSNGGAMKVTTAVYLTPKGRDINKKGIAPDVVATDDPETAAADETVDAALELIAGTSTVN